jgi:arylsulfatase A-like enzyme
MIHQTSGRHIAIPMACALLALLFLLTGCSPGGNDTAPNIIWIVWDTVRADRMSLYGHSRPTTPFVDQWAKEGLVFDNCLSVASTTVPAHASMFTNLLPSGHGADNTYCFLPGELTTLPELFQQHGYQTAIYSENPYISQEAGFTQGFDAIWHPWDPQYRDQVATALLQKLPPQMRTGRLNQKLREKGAPPWAFTACGDFGRRLLCSWLSQRDQKRPVFVFLNYMEAHLPIITPERFRHRTMTPPQVAQSYQLNNSPAATWRYVFGFSDYQPTEKEIIRATYDAALMELDELFRKLMESLKDEGLADNTIIILSSDHGEHLCEHHLLDHQYSLYQELLSVPLVIHCPSRIKAGREIKPVTNMDIFPTLLELAGIAAPDSLPAGSISLLHPASQRKRLAEYPTPHQPPIDEMRSLKPNWDPSAFLQSRLTLQIDPFKLILNQNGPPELYNLVNDRAETNNLATEEPQRVAEMSKQISDMRSEQIALRHHPAQEAELSKQQRSLLRSMGYLGSTSTSGNDSLPVSSDSLENR